MPILLTLKLLLVPSLIGLITLAGRRWGPTIAGWLSAFPVISGPILFFIAYEQGNEFASIAAAGTLSSVVAIITFGITYAWAATRFDWRGSLVTALLFYALAVTILNALQIPVYAAMVISLITIAVAPKLFPKIEPLNGKAASSPFDVPMRMAVGAILVLSVTYFASNLGPRLVGFFAMFPVMSTVLTVFSHRTAGKNFAIALLKGMLLGWYSFSAFCFSLTLLLREHGLFPSFLVATIVAAIVQFTTRRFLVKH